MKILETLFLIVAITLSTGLAYELTILNQRCGKNGISKRSLNRILIWGATTAFFIGLTYYFYV